MKIFPLAPMDPPIRWMTTLLLALPLALLVGALLAGRFLSIIALLLVAIDAWVWLRFRPGWFVVHPDKLEVIWPLKQCEILRTDIVTAQVIGREELREKIGSGLRLGAGGLWGGFGWLWTKRRGIVQMYISRTDGFVWIERMSGRPWLVTPEQPEAFVLSLATG